MSETRSKNAAKSVDAELFLRSINIAYDADHPERISHFRPTAKCAPLIRALVGNEEQRAFFLVAPYGSGKSLTAAYAGHLVENNKSSGEVRLEINRRLEVVSPVHNQGGSVAGAKILPPIGPSAPKARTMPCPAS